MTSVILRKVVEHRGLARSSVTSAGRPLPDNPGRCRGKVTYDEASEIGGEEIVPQRVKLLLGALLLSIGLLGMVSLGSWSALASGTSGGHQNTMDRMMIRCTGPERAPGWTGSRKPSR